LVLDLPIETAGKREYRTVQARLLSESARLDVARTAWDVRRRVREALLGLYHTVQVERNLQKEWQLYTSKVEFLGHWYDAGEISGMELAQARIELAQSRNAWLKADREKSRDLASLAQALGLPQEALKGIQFSFDAFESAPPAGFPALVIQRQALLNRADLLAVLAEYQASQYALQQEIARQYPDIQIGPGYEFDQSDNKWTLGFSVALPLFNRNQGAINVAEASREEVAARFQSVQADILAQISQSFVQYQVSIERLNRADELAREMEAQVKRVEKTIQLGEGLDLDRINKELEYNALLASRLEDLITVQQAISRIEDSMQTASDLPGGERGLGQVMNRRQEGSADE